MRYIFSIILITIQGIALAQSAKDCRALPSYTTGIGFDAQRAAFSTSEHRKMGLCYVELSNDPSKPNRVYQHPSWNMAGWLGAMLVVETGDVFVAPTPTVNVYYNKPEEQNFLYQVDAKTQEMRKVLALPAATAPSSENPFGLIGLAYDCDTKIIYASSLAGSTREKEHGRVFAINRQTMQVIDTLLELDCMGIGVYTLQGEKRLFLGKARNGEIMSIGLAPDGTFKGAMRKEISLEGLGPRGDDIARKIRLLPDGTLQVQGIEFYFNLIAPTEKQETKYLYKFINQRWTLIRVE